MFDYELPKPKEPVDYTGVKIVAILAPVFLLFVLLGNADMGLTACIVLGMVMLAVKIRWNLRKHLWFWIIIISILALHIPLIRIIRWPQGKLPTIGYTMPIGLLDFLVVLGTLGLGEKFLGKNSPPNDEKE